jgi:excisionase family DNA binding protein
MLLFIFDSFSISVYDTNMPESDDRILKLKELSAYLKIPESTLYKIAWEGGIPAQKIGKHWRFDRRAINAWMARGTHQ